MRITRDDGLIDRDQAAEMCDVSPDAITIWSTRGYVATIEDADGKRTERHWLEVALREGRKPLYRVADVAEANRHTRKSSGRDKLIPNILPKAA